MMRILILASAAAGAALATRPEVFPVAQSPEVRQAPAQDAKARRTAESADDAFLAAWAVAGSSEAAALAHFAAERAANPAVRQLAQSLQADHRAIAEELESFAQERGRRAADSKAEEASAGRGSRACEHVALLRELGDACQSALKAGLADKRGPEFDRCYVRWVIASQHCAMSQVGVLQRHASAELAGILRSAESRIAGQLERAKGLGQEVEGAPGDERGSRGK